MRIDLTDPRVGKAIDLVKKEHNIPFGRAFERIFEERYHCRIVPDPNDMLCTRGHLVISEEKYQTWFLLNFGAGDESVHNV